MTGTRFTRTSQSRWVMGKRVKHLKNSFIPRDMLLQAEGQRLHSAAVAHSRHASLKDQL